jgi:hypothetical protein
MAGYKQLLYQSGKMLDLLDELVHNGKAWCLRRCNSLTLPSSLIFHA